MFVMRFLDKISHICPYKKTAYYQNLSIKFGYYIFICRTGNNYTSRFFYLKEFMKIRWKEFLQVYNGFYFLK